jgi:Family of unknown function (DUF5320)
MPGLDRNGPLGNGPMTGGGRGFCHITDSVDNAWFIGAPCRGFRGIYSSGMRRGRGYAWRNQPAYAAMPFEGPDAELKMLKTHADFLKKTLQTINRKVAELEENAKQSTGTEKADD